MILSEGIIKVSLSESNSKSYFNVFIFQNEKNKNSSILLWLLFEACQSLSSKVVDTLVTEINNEKFFNKIYYFKSHCIL